MKCWWSHYTVTGVPVMWVHFWSELGLHSFSILLVGSGTRSELKKKNRIFTLIWFLALASYTTSESPVYVWMARKTAVVKPLPELCRRTAVCGRPAGPWCGRPGRVCLGTPSPAPPIEQLWRPSSPVGASTDTLPDKPQTSKLHIQLDMWNYNYCNY